ncbi:MAG: AAA family ATPase [Pseudomonadota bacterium]
MNLPKPDSDWSLGEADDEFVLEEDETFGAGEIVTADLPPFEEPEAAPIEAPAEFDDPFGLATPMPAAAPIDGGQIITDQPVPRITIHACCDRAEIADIVAAVSADRRLARADVTVEAGGVEVAVQRFATQASPNLLILDSTLPGHALLKALDRLSECMEEGCKVVIIGAVNDITLFRELMARGISEYIVPPISPKDLIHNICNLYVNPEKPFAGRVVAVIGARGGVGASTVAHNLAWSIAERQEAGATLLDLDLSFGTAALDFNQDPQQDISDALTAPDRADDVFLERITIKHTQRLQMLTAPAKLEQEFEIDPTAYETVIQRVRKSSPYIVLDLPHVWSSWVKQTLYSADDVLIVASPDLASLRNTKNILDLMKATRPYDNPPAVVLNMTGVPKRPEIPFKEFSEALGQEPVAAFAFDPALFGMAANNGQMIGEVQPMSKQAIGIDTLAASLTGRKPPEVKKTSLAAKIPFLKR